MRASKTILSILGSDKINRGDRVMVLDEQAAEKLNKQFYLIESDEDTYKIAFDTEMGISKTLYHLGIDG